MNIDRDLKYLEKQAGLKDVSFNLWYPRFFVSSVWPFMMDHFKKSPHYKQLSGFKHRDGKFSFALNLKHDGIIHVAVQYSYGIGAARFWGIIKDEKTGKMTNISHLEMPYDVKASLAGLFLADRMLDKALVSI